MSRYRWTASWCAAALVAASGLSAEPAADAPARLARRLWAVTDVILARHVDPPARQEMLLAALKVVHQKTGVATPVGLGRLMSEVTSDEQFAALLRTAWPADRGAADSVEDLALHTLLGNVPGSPRIVGPDELKFMEVNLGNRYVGTGIQVRYRQDEGFVQIVIPFAGGPARRAGARVGDLIVSVDGADMKGKTTQEYVRQLRGDEGTDVTMTVRQPGSDETRTLKMTRSVVPFATAVGYRRTGEESWAYRVDPDLPVAYVRLNAVNASTLHELRKLERTLADDGIRSLILDLRSTQGGEMTHAVQVADGLLDGGLLWRVRDASGRRTEYRADRDCLFRDRRLVVLVDGNTRSAVEQVAAALQDNKRATLVGERTGTDPSVRIPGVMQRADLAPAVVPSVPPLTPELPVRGLVDLPDGLGKLLLQTAVAERASGRPWGVQPDVEVRVTPQQQAAISEWKRDQESPEADATRTPPEDPQLAKALELLRKGNG